MMTLRPFSFSDIAFVVERLAPLHIAELAGLGHIPAHFQSVVTQLVSTSECALTVLKDGTPVGVLGVEPQDDDLYTFFVATDDFYENGAHAALIGRRAMRYMARRFGVVRTLTISKNRNLHRWLKAIGGVPVERTDSYQVYAWFANPAPAGVDRAKLGETA